MFKQETSDEENIIKQETAGVEETPVVVVEGTAVKVEIKKENTDTGDPFSDHVHQGE